MIAMNGWLRVIVRVGGLSVVALRIDGHRARLIPKAIEDDCLTQLQNRTRRISVSGLERIKLSLQNHSVPQCLLWTAKTTECKNDGDGAEEDETATALDLHPLF